MPSATPESRQRTNSSDRSSSSSPALHRPFTPRSSRLNPETPPRRPPLRCRIIAPPIPTAAAVTASPVEEVTTGVDTQTQWTEAHERTDTLEDDAASDTTINPDFITLDLSDSGLNTIPVSLFAETDCFLQIQTLNLSHNSFDASIALYITDTLILPSLASLSLRSCNMVNVKPLVKHLKARNLKELDISSHRITASVPRLRRPFPRLQRLLTREGSFEQVQQDAVKGLRLVELRENLIKDRDGRIRARCAMLGTRILL